MSTAKDEREAARGPMRETIGIGVDLIKYLEEEEQQWKEEAIQVGLDFLKDAFGRYKAASQILNHESSE